MWRLKSLVGAGVAFVAASALIAWISLSIRCNPPNGWPGGNACQLVKWAYDWQQMLGGLFAIGAAVMGWIAINKQIGQSENQERERTRRNYDAARAVLPLALSSLVDYAQSCVVGLAALHDCAQGETILRKDLRRLRIPPIPEVSTSYLRAMVEASGPSEGRAIAVILAQVQIQAARLRSVLEEKPLANDEIVILSNVEQYIVDSIEIHARASALFRFGRGDTNEVPSGKPDLAQMFNSTMSLGLMDGRFDRIRERVERQYGSDSKDPKASNFQ